MQDDLRFGWQDAIVAANAVRSVAAYADVLEWCHGPPAAATMRALYTRVRSTYNSVFWDNDKGFYRLVGRLVG